jgi:Uma2 family endonuclease
MATLTKWSLQDYHKMIEAGILEGRQVELINGEIVEMSPEGPIHSNNIIKTAHYLERLLQNVAHVREAHPITLSKSEPEPDIAVVKGTIDNYWRSHPTKSDIYLLIEVAQSSVYYDKVVKAKLYAAEGIPEYWLIDLNNNVVIVYTAPQNGQYKTVANFNDGIITPISFPKITVEVEKLLPRQS